MPCGRIFWSNNSTTDLLKCNSNKVEFDLFTISLTNYFNHTEEQKFYINIEMLLFKSIRVIITWWHTLKVTFDRQGPEKSIGWTKKVLLAGTIIFAWEDKEQATSQASLNASVSSLKPSPFAPNSSTYSTRLDLSRVLLDPECGSCIRDPNPSTSVRFELRNAATKKIWQKLKLRIFISCQKVRNGWRLMVSWIAGAS